MAQYAIKIPDDISPARFFEWIPTRKHIYWSELLQLQWTESETTFALVQKRFREFRAYEDQQHKTGYTEDEI